MTTEATPERIRYTADAVVLSADGHLLLIKRRWAPFEGCWALPGGHVDAGETSLVAAVRELGEETGILVPESEFWQLGVYDEPGRDPRGRYVTVAYTATVAEPLTPVPATDALEARWFPFDDLPELAFDHHRIITDATRGGAGA
ncbi:MULTISPECIES: NUDIX hydrolase [unclassified Streptomyces]|uniref:NUDIX domain-containing protein n=1 Tax=unclassified Streptomyces TaxID=2593676 RepID=UPI00081BB0AE|nr:NUDIX hydrolase [Streptomyces sp. BvitLS-983]MYX48641.1 NUDIX domain-containing protein [Streptomyces sp. SID8385]MYX87224.1 NUDIX domain-containing protein [Streptomyces sp. SID4915]SCD99357.1 8-oxo-dGTP diphosphatase [Streptomyces sp. BvitLS-983]